MLTIKRLASAAQEVNLRMQPWDPTWLWNPGQMSPEIQNRGISAPLPPKLNLKKKISHTANAAAILVSTQSRVGV